MRTIGFVAAIAVLAIAGSGLAAAQPQNFTDPGLELGGPFPAVNDLRSFGTLTFFPDRAALQAAHPGLPSEDFTGTLVGNGGIVACDAPLDSGTNDACFSIGSVIDGFALNPVVDGGGGQYVVLNNALGMPCVGVGPNSFVDETDWDFNPAVAAVGVDLFTPLGGGETFTFEIFGPGGSLGSVNVVAGGTAAVFFGVDTVDPGGITRIEVREAADNTGDIFCNLEFGDPPVPVMLQRVGVE